MKPYIIVFSILIAVSGCGTVQTKIDNSYILNKDSGEGLVVTGIKHGGMVAEYSVYYKNTETDFVSKFKAGKGQVLIPLPLKSDYPNDMGELNVAKVPAGEYEITHWGVHCGYFIFGSPERIGTKFKVDPGEIVYLGSFDFEVTGRFGLGVTDVDVSYEDDFKVDEKAFREKYPSLASEAIRMALEPNLNIDRIGTSEVEVLETGGDR